jgi:3-oxoacyl-[acyl-carrier-protein] synthase III
MRTRGTFIRSVGGFLPDVISVEHAIAEGWYSAEDAAYFGILGAAVAGDLPAPEMAVLAAREAFERSRGRSPQELDLLLYTDVWHQGPDGWQPQYYVQQHLTGGDVLSIELRHGCCGLFSALQLASSYLAAVPDRRTALLVGADNHGTPLVDRWRMIEGTVMGDAGCAVLLDVEAGPLELLAVNLTTVPEAEAVNDGSVPLFPPDATIGRPLDFRTRNEEFRKRLLDRRGNGVLLTVQSKLMELVETTLAESGIGMSDVTRVAFPHGRRDDLEERGLNWLDIPLGRSTWDFGRRVGHLGVADQFIALAHILENREISPGDHVLLVGLGAGTTMACAVVRVLEEGGR